MNINWSKFDENSSERETLFNFADGMSIRRLNCLIWSDEARLELKKINKLPIKIARRRAKKWLLSIIKQIHMKSVDKLFALADELEKKTMEVDMNPDINVTPVSHDWRKYDKGMGLSELTESDQTIPEKELKEVIGINATRALEHMKSSISLSEKLKPYLMKKDPNSAYYTLLTDIDTIILKYNSACRILNMKK